MPFAGAASACPFVKLVWPVKQALAANIDHPASATDDRCHLPPRAYLMPLQLSSTAMDASVSAPVGRWLGRQELDSMQIRPPRGPAPLYQASRHDQGCEGCRGLLQPHLLPARLWCAPLSVVAPSQPGWHIGALACLRGANRHTVIYVAPRKGPGDRFVYFVWQQTLPSSLYFAAPTITGGCHEPSPARRLTCSPFGRRPLSLSKTALERTAKGTHRAMW